MTFSKPFDQIAKADINALVSSQASEGRELDYKNCYLATHWTKNGKTFTTPVASQNLVRTNSMSGRMPGDVLRSWQYRQAEQSGRSELRTLLNGNGFRVDQEVPTDGLTAHFTLRSDVGTFQANGLEMLRIRVAEIPAIEELTQTSKTKVFAQSLATNAMAPVTAAGQMLMHPVDTVIGLPGGVGRFFGRVGFGAQKIKEAATEPEEASTSEKAGQVATRTLQTTRDVLGYEQERRGLAKKLHVHPYTTNPILSKQLDDFALVAFRAHIGVTTTMSVFIPGSIAITATRVVSTWV